MLYMVIEHFRDVAAVGARFQEHGRMMPLGVIYHASWIDAKSESRFQIVECDNRALLDQWMKGWDDLVDFEVSEVMTSNEFWEPPQTASTIYEMVMSYPMAIFDRKEPQADLRQNIMEALQAALLESSGD